MRMLCTNLPRPPFRSCGVGQRIDVAPNRSLVLIRQVLVLLDQNIFNLAQGTAGKRRPNSCENVRDIETKLIGDSAQVRGSGIARSRFPVRLRPFGNSQCFGNLELREPTSLAFLLEARTYFFRKMHFFSSLLFTSAPKCIIVHLTPHEIARICTMPNSSITEQARQKAREALEKRGQSIKDFAVKHQLNPSTVYAVLSGQSHCRRGEAHRAAVLLGIKKGVIAQ